MTTLAFRSSPPPCPCPHCEAPLGVGDLTCGSCGGGLWADLVLLQPVASPRVRYRVACDLLDRGVVSTSFGQLAWLLEHGGTLARGLSRAMAMELSEWLRAEGMSIELVDLATRPASGFHVKGGAPRVSSIPPPAVPHDASTYRAAPGRILPALVVDHAMILVPAGALAVLAMRFAGTEPSAHAQRFALGGVFFGVLFGLCALVVAQLLSLASRGQTLAARWASLRVVRADGSLPLLGELLFPKAGRVLVVDLRRMPIEAVERSRSSVPVEPSAP